MEVQVGVRLCLGDTVVDFVYFAGRNEPEQLVGGGCRMRVVTAFYYRIRKQLKELGRKLGKKAWWVAGIGVVCLLLLFSGLYLMKKGSAMDAV